jgi:hypothetical protein
MDAASQSNHVIQSLRIGDLVGHRQQPEHQEVLTVDEQRLLVVRFIALGDVVVPF